MVERGDVCNDFVAGVTGVNHVRSFGVIGDHPTDFFAGAETYYAADKGVDISEWVMPVDGTVRYAPGTSKGVVAVRVDDGICWCCGWHCGKGSVAVAAVVRDG